jgi:nucleoside-diphosphate-sugar epimerase
VSSVSALGSVAVGGEITENAIWKSSKSKTYYALTKFRSEMEVWRGIEEGLNTVIVNPGVVLGPGKWERGSLQLFHRIDKGLRYYTEGVTSFVDVRDVSHAMIRLMERGAWGERFILHSENLSYREILSLIAVGLNKRPPDKRISPLLMESLWRLEKVRSGLTGGVPVITKESARSGGTKKYFSNKKISELLGIEFRPMRDSIQEICEMYLKEQ